MANHAHLQEFIDNGDIGGFITAATEELRERNENITSLDSQVEDAREERQSALKEEDDKYAAAVDELRFAHKQRQDEIRAQYEPVVASAEVEAAQAVEEFFETYEYATGTGLVTTKGLSLVGVEKPRRRTRVIKNAVENGLIETAGESGSNQE